MNESLEALASPVAVLIGATLFVILFTVILTTLGRAQAFPTGTNVTLAICASLLAVIGMMRTFGHAEEATGSSGSSWMDVILLPYAAMGIAMLLVLLLLLRRNVISGREKALRRPKCQVRAESRGSTDGRHERTQGDGSSRLAKE